MKNAKNLAKPNRKKRQRLQHRKWTLVLASAPCQRHVLPMPAQADVELKGDPAKHHAAASREKRVTATAASQVLGGPRLAVPEER